MIIVGLTGSFGTGKSTVAKSFKDRGAVVLDADAVSRDFVEKGPGKKIVLKWFGKKILTRGQIDREKVAAIVFNDKKALKRLMRTVHPAVIKEFRKKISDYRKGGKVKVVIMDVPLLFESGMDKMADVTITVKASQQDQIRRTTKKFKMNKTEALKRIRNQMPLSKKISLSDIIIDNRGSLKDVDSQVSAVWNKLQKRYFNRGT
jgi:dephospho-CoA kinase